MLSFFNKLKLKTDIFKTVYSGITDVLVFMSDDYEDTRFLDALLPKVIDGKKEKLLEFLTAIDIGIKDITYKEKETLFFTFHKGADGELYPLNLYDESEGTIKSIMLFIHAHMAIINDYVLVMDELNVKLHPLLLKFFIDLFYDNNSMAQLIYTTHDTTLMDKNSSEGTRFGLYRKTSWDIRNYVRFRTLRCVPMHHLKRIIGGGIWRNSIS